MLRRIILYGGLKKDQYKLIKEDLQKKNSSYLLYFSILGVVLYGALTLITICTDAYSLNRGIYSLMLLLSIVLLIAVLVLPKNKPFVNKILMYVFLAMLYVAGIYTTLTDINQKATVFMVYVMVVPLLFVIPPINVYIVEVLGEIVYLIVISNLQTGYALETNFWNSIIFTIAAMIIGTNVLQEKTASVFHANRNIYLLETDIMTGLGNRRSFENQLDLINNGKKVYAVVSFDVNGLKGANDNIGHHAGDELICGAADIIKESFGPYGSTYRIGGDEYAALIFKDFHETDLRKTFQENMEGWKGTYNPAVHISYGLVKIDDLKGQKIQEIIKQADSLMYQDKSDYYVRNHLERRKS